MWTVVASFVIVFAAATPDAGVATPLEPADGLGLAATPVGRGSEPVSDPVPPARSVPLGAAGVSAVLMGGVGVVAMTHRRRNDAPLVVVVHGNGGDPTDFDELLRQIGVPGDRVVRFDWRTAGTGETSTEASRRAGTDVASRELELLLRELSAGNSNIYTIHHSKGGAVGVDLLSRLDRGVRPPIDGWRGAALLDPAISHGPLGLVQRLGRPFSFIPDNGGFDPYRCEGGDCTDMRADLGEAAGVEVIAIRNPDAVLTNFTGRPPGLRVYDLEDDGRGSAYASMLFPPLALRRVFEAHRSVLTHPSVAACIGAEIEQVRSCIWTGSSIPRIGWRGPGGASRPRAL